MTHNVKFVIDVQEPHFIRFAKTHLQLNESNLDDELHDNGKKQELIEAFKIIAGQDKRVTYEQLNEGDFKYIVDGVEECIVERKTIADFASSVRNNHLREQTVKMLEKRRDTKPRIRMLWLIEGNLETLSNYENSKFPLDFYYSILNDFAANYDMGLILTRDMAHTAVTLLRMIHRYEQKGSSSFVENNADIINVLPTGRKTGLTPEKYFIQALKQVPQVNVIQAKAFAKEFGSFEKLVQQYVKYGVTYDSTTLCQKVTLGNGKNVPYHVSRNVFQYVMGVSELPKELQKAPKAAKRKSRPKAKGKGRKPGKSKNASRDSSPVRRQPSCTD